MRKESTSHPICWKVKKLIPTGRRSLVKAMSFPRNAFRFSIKKLVYLK